jgi:hypothetical protein
MLTIIMLKVINRWSSPNRKAMKMVENDLDLDFPPKSRPQEPDRAILSNNHTGV